MEILIQDLMSMKKNFLTIKILTELTIMKKWFKKGINSFLGRFGYKIIKQEEDKIVLHENILLKDFFKFIKSVGFKPKHIMDIGANTGTWTYSALNYFPEASFSLFEPQHWLKDIILKKCNNDNVIVYPLGVGKKKGVFDFTLVDREDSCTFRYNEEEAKEKGFKQIKLPVTTIDSFLLEHNMQIPEIVKIDTEGLDLEVLEGATMLHGKTELFLIEAAVMNKSLDNNLLKVVEFMSQIGYQLFDITDLNRPFNQKVLWLVELVFVKKGGFFDSIDYKS